MAAQARRGAREAAGTDPDIQKHGRLVLSAAVRLHQAGIDGARRKFFIPQRPPGGRQRTRRRLYFRLPLAAQSGREEKYAQLTGKGADVVSYLRRAAGRRFYGRGVQTRGPGGGELPVPELHGPDGFVRLHGRQAPLGLLRRPA